MKPRAFLVFEERSGSDEVIDAWLEGSFVTTAGDPPLPQPELFRAGVE